MRVLSALLALPAAAALAPRAAKLTGAYTFEEYALDYQKVYANSDERATANLRFKEELARVLAHNADASRSYKMGVNQFTDSAPAKGYSKMPAGKSLLLGAEAPELPFTIDRVEDLPASVDWRTVPNVVTATKDQGGCGSCWAFATTEVVESHVAIATNTLFNLSPQMLVSCMENPSQCGGQGGCKGATCELGFDFFAKEGILEEYQLGYSSYGGEDGKCTLNVTSSSAAPFAAAAAGQGPDPPGLSGAVATIEGYVKLPENEYLPLMNAVAKVGPIAITVDAAWGGYESGVFTMPDSNYTNFNLDHAVVLVGYGHDAASGLDYWLVRNSWAPTWGEGGYIRLQRNDGTDAFCGVDTAPCDGTACASLPGACNTTVKVCGTSGILYDCSYPTGAALNK